MREAHRNVAKPEKVSMSNDTLLTICRLKQCTVLGIGCYWGVTKEGTKEEKRQSEEMVGWADR